MPPHFDQYILQVEDIDLEEAFIQSMEVLENTAVNTLQEIGNEVYAAGKWTIPDIIQHITDTERVMAYRALRFGRKDATPLAGFDQDLYTGQARAYEKDLAGLWEELKIVRQSSILLFGRFEDEELQRRGICNQIEMSVLALGFMIVGHQKHHLRIIEERYLPLAEKKAGR